MFSNNRPESCLAKKVFRCIRRWIASRIRLASAPPNTLVVIDYLQLLDQKRENPDLMHQVQQLRSFARERQLIILCLSQIDRRYDSTNRSCPGIDDVRLPNPLDLSLFDKTCFLHQDTMQIASSA